jgi:hypothetical protein
LARHLSGTLRASESVSANDEVAVQPFVEESHCTFGWAGSASYIPPEARDLR